MTSQPGRVRGQKAQDAFSRENGARGAVATVAGMKVGAAAVVALVAAVLGGAVALAGARTAGWVGDGAAATTTTVFVGDGTAPAVPASTTRSLTGNGFDPAAIYASRSAGVVTIYSFFGSGTSNAAQGSGFVVSADGHILTNSHVVTDTPESGGVAQGATKIYVEFADGDRIEGKVVGWDVFDDVGLVRVDPADHAIAAVPLGDSAQVSVGEPVAAIGSPFGNQNSLAVGVVAATGRSIGSITSRYDVADAIQIDAPINHGNSGGPLFDARGRVIGINAQINSESGNAEGVGFAIPINAAKRSMEQLISTGKVAYAFIGVSAEDVTPAIAKHFRYKTERGALVSRVEAGTPAARAGLRGAARTELFNGANVSVGGDVIVAIDGQRVGSAEDLIRIVSDRLRPGETARLTILRQGTTRLSIPVELGERAATPIR